MKICSICKIEKEDTEYESGRRQCKLCRKNYKKEYSIKNKDAITIYKKDYYVANKDDIVVSIKIYQTENKEKISNYWKNYNANSDNKEHNKEKKKEYRKVNKGTIKENRQIYYLSNKKYFEEKGKEYRKNNKDAIKEYDKEYRLNNRKDILSYKKEYHIINKDKELEYRLNNKEDISAYQKEYKKKKYNNVPSFKIRALISRSILKQLKINKSSKNRLSCLNFLQYSIEELELYLEQQFEPWMNWSNHGKYNSKTWNDNDQSTWTWQIDHIAPHSTFKYNSMEDQAFKDCWALSNLRPLSAKQNILDGVKRTRHK